jgi:glycosyltransferase involved in cell wall biosynthesis
MMELFQAAKEVRDDAFVLILTQRNKEKIAAELGGLGFGENDFSVLSVPPIDVPKYLGASDVAVSFIKSCYSKQSSSPTKIAEYLAAGLPVVANRGVGDVDSTIENNSVGAILDSFDRDSYLESIREVIDLGGVADRARNTAVREFDLGTVGGVRYRRIYSRLLGTDASN